ncbi:MAG: hypothetical protein JXN61_03155 [Sedimentisphaerales bacterium]|nr:hypothetical protein [Sedimentisphaerales bacterium]
MCNFSAITVFLPLIVGFGLLFVPNRFKLVTRALTLVIAALAFALSVQLFTGGGDYFSWNCLQVYDFTLDLVLSTTPLGTFLLMFACGFGILITLYSFKSMADAKHSSVFYGAVLLTIGGSAGILLSNHLLFLLIFWEIVTASLYLMITTGGRNSNFAATKSFAMIGASDAAFLLGVLFVGLSSHTFAISAIDLKTSGALPITAFLLLMTAAIAKAGAMPLHTWLPTSGESAPTSVMALLPAAIDKLLGIYLLVLIVKDIFVLESAVLSIILALVGSATIVIAVMVAMAQHNLKRLLSYHAVSQVGYMMLGIATMTPVGIAGGVFHMLNNAVYKCCLFLCGGAAEQQAGTAELDQLGGLGKKMPVTFVTCLIAALSISGIPPLNGFVSKWMIYQGVIQMGAGKASAAAGFWPFWLVAAMFGSALTLASFIKLVHSIFLSRLPDALRDVKEVSPLQTIPMIVLAFLCLYFGIFYFVPLNYFILPGLGLELVDITTTIGALWQGGLATVLILVGIALGMAVLLIGGLFKNKVRIVPTWTCGEIQENEKMTVPGTHFYKTVSCMGGLKQLYEGQEKRWFDPYDQSGRVGLGLTEFLRWLHSGVLPMYLTWVTLGLVVVLFVLCDIW